MKAKLFIIVFIFISNIFWTQNFIQLIGVEYDDSEFSEGSYAVMYDSKFKKRKNKDYEPFQTIGIYRNVDSVEIMSLDYLMTPTKEGFIYATLDVIETKYNSEKNDLDIPENTYKLSSSITHPKFFKTQESIVKFMEHQKPTFEDAIEIDFEKISFINSNFYLTKGFESYVHGGASWFNASEKTNIYPLDLKANLSNKLINYIDNHTKNEIIIKTINDMKDYNFDENINSNSILPWAGSISDHNNVYYDISFDNNGVKITPLTLLQGNSSRSFLEKGKALKDPKMYNDLKLDKFKLKTPSSISFISPDKTTKIEIVNNQLIITDIKSNSLLKKATLNYNKIIMSEFALGIYAKKWKNKFK